MSWNEFTEKLLSKLTSELRKRRVELFIKKLGIGPGDVILDLGSEDGSYLGECYPWPQNVIIADIREDVLKMGMSKYPFKDYVVIPEKGPLPFKDKEFDAVWCNSVIEHVTLTGKEKEYLFHDKYFRKISEANQKKFASEISRIGRKYFVQTPYLHFPIETHSWLPFIQYLPTRYKYKISKISMSIWVKRWDVNFHLYDRKRFEEDFSDAREIYFEKILGIPKSLIAIKY